MPSLCGAGNKAQGFMYARQTFYQLKHIPNPHAAICELYAEVIKWLNITSKSCPSSQGPSHIAFHPTVASIGKFMS